MSMRRWIIAAAIALCSFASIPVTANVARVGSVQIAQAPSSDHAADSTAVETGKAHTEASGSHAPPVAGEPEHGAADADHAKGDAGHGEHEPSAAPPELPSLATVVLHTRILDGKEVRHTHFGHWLHVWEKQLFLILSVTLLAVVIFGTLRLRAMVPGRLQTLLELIVDGFYKFFSGILGEKNARKYMPFMASLFVFIIVNNLMGITPLMAAATSKFQTTVTLAIIVFFYIHYNGIRESGFGHFFHHLMGAPRDALGWAMTPLLLPLEIIGTLAKPLSLSLRLFGNIMGEDILIGVFLILGMMLMGAVWPDPLIGVPLHLPFMFLALLTSTIQALVFTMLSTIYLMMLLPHPEHEHEHHEDGQWHKEHQPEVPGLPEDRPLHVGIEASPFA